MAQRCSSLTDLPCGHIKPDRAQQDRHPVVGLPHLNLVHQNYPSFHADNCVQNHLQQEQETGMHLSAYSSKKPNEEAHQTTQDLYVLIYDSLNF